MQHRSDVSCEVAQCLVEALIVRIVISCNLNLSMAPLILAAGVASFYFLSEG